MSDLDIPALKAAAQAVPSWSGMADTPMMPTWHGDPSYGGKTHRYIALANPATVLALIERLEAAEERADGMERAGAEQARRADENAEVIRQLRARIERLEAVAEAAKRFVNYPPDYPDCGKHYDAVEAALAALEAP